MCTSTQFGNKSYIVCDHPPRVDVMSELLCQGRIGVEILVCVVPDAICVCSEFIRLLPSNFSWSLHLACSSRIVSISDIWGLRCSQARITWIVTYPGLPNRKCCQVGKNHPRSLCSSDTLKEGENIFWLQTVWLFCRSFFTFTHSICRVFHSTKSLSWTQMCPLWSELSHQYVAGGWYLGCWFAGILEMSGEDKPGGPSWASHSMPTTEGGIEQKSLFASSNLRRRNSLELLLLWVVSQAECEMWRRDFTHAVFRKGYC